MPVNNAIVAQGVGKAYRLYERGWDRLREWLGSAPRHRTHWALSPMDLTIACGESVGIVGSNGAGKSTLLKLIAQVLLPTQGQLQVQGRVCALLELGLGFDPERTGWDNLHIAGQLLGLTRAEIIQLSPWIVEFSELGEAMQEPVRSYSSGMQMRLAFALAVAKRPDILIVDEALSVGDIFFQQKCYELITRYHREGTTLLFVTHSMGALQHLCDRALLLDHGELILDGEPQAVINLFESRGLAARAQNAAISISEVKHAPAAQQGSLVSSELILENVTWLNQAHQVIQHVNAESDVTLMIQLLAQVDHEDLHVGMKLRDKYGLVIYETNTYCQQISVGHVRAGQQVCVGFTMPLNVREGSYNVTVGVAKKGFALGSFEEQLCYVHGQAPIEVMRINDLQLWDGITNLHPKIEVSFPEKTVMPPISLGGNQ